MIKFKLDHWEMNVYEVEVERETDKCVFVKTLVWGKETIRRYDKRSEQASWCDSLEEARQRAIAIAEKEQKAIQDSYDYNMGRAINSLQKAKNITEARKD